MRWALLWLLASACGRIAFDPLGSTTNDGGGGDDGAGADATDGATALVPVRSQCQAALVTSPAVSSLGVNLATAVPSTHTIVVAIGWNTVAANIASISDNGGSSYVAAAGTLAGGAESQAIYLAATPAPGSQLLSVLFTQPVINASMRVCTYAGTDQNMGPPALGAGGTGTFASAGPLVTTIPNSLVLAAVTGTSNAGLDFAYVTAINTMPLGHVVEEHPAANTGSYLVSASFGVNTDWVIQMIALQPR